MVWAIVSCLGLALLPVAFAQGPLMKAQGPLMKVTVIDRIEIVENGTTKKEADEMEKIYSEISHRSIHSYIKTVGVRENRRAPRVLLPIIIFSGYQDGGHILPAMFRVSLIGVPVPMPTT